MPLKEVSLLAMLLAACAPRADREPAADRVALQLAASDAGCELDSVRPTTGAPAEGLWLYENGTAEHRVAAIIGPPQSVAGQSQVTRRVETLEVRAGADTIRLSSDTVSLRLEFIPPFSRPAAVYSIGPLVRLAAYEPCGGRQQPLIRYLRQDEAGRVATDVLLQREAKP
jgi:hypothetical protein